MICPVCRTENPNSNWYCLSCGESLRNTKTPPRAVTRAKKPARGRTRPVKAVPGQAVIHAETVFAGRYTGLTRIGEGAMATVYRALDTVLDQTVALKVLHPGLAVNQDYITRFKREIALARTITHPNVYRIYDIGQTAELHFISMEYIDGEELKSLIETQRLSLDEGLRIMLLICLALEQAHQKGVIHRDLKPQNIMLEKETDRCVVMDFGIAIGETGSSVTQAGTFVGTPEYISPEQALGGSVDFRTDIYSAGIIMYEMFTGRLPFGPGKPLAVALQQVNATPVAPRKISAQLPAGLESIILKAMAKEPGQRYPDAGSMAAALESLIQGSGEPQSGAEEASGPGVAQVRDSQNPYLNRNMIRDKRSFFGRTKEIATIYSRLGAARPQSVSIVGERRIGKSSLLHYINQPDNRAAYLKDSGNYLFIFMDFQEKRRVTAEEFFASLFAEIHASAGDRLPGLTNPGYAGFKELCESLDERKMKLILLFDEFESITKNKNFEPEFFAFLRSIANNFNVAYVTSSVRNLQELCYNREISDSPFFNIFSNLILGPFSRAEALKFVSEPSLRFGNPLEEHFETVVELAGYFPFYMAIAGSILFDFDFTTADPRKTVFENVEELFLDEARMHFQFILNNLSQDETATCLRLIEGAALSDIDRYVMKGLLKRGYLIPGEADSEASLFSRTFAKILVEQRLKATK